MAAVLDNLQIAADFIKELFAYILSFFSSFGGSEDAAV